MERHKSRHWLKKKHLIDGFTSDEIGDLCGVTGRAIRYHLKKFGIKQERNSDMGAREVHAKLPYFLHEGLKNHSNCHKITISSVIRVALIEFMVRNNFNPYKDKNV